MEISQSYRALYSLCYLNLTVSSGIYHKHAEWASDPSLLLSASGVNVGAGKGEYNG